MLPSGWCLGQPDTCVDGTARPLSSGHPSHTRKYSGSDEKAGLFEHQHSGKVEELSHVIETMFCLRATRYRGLTTHRALFHTIRLLQPGAGRQALYRH